MGTIGDGFDPAPPHPSPEAHIRTIAVSMSVILGDAHSIQIVNRQRDGLVVPNDGWARSGRAGEGLRPCLRTILQNGARDAEPSDDPMAPIQSTLAPIIHTVATSHPRDALRHIVETAYHIVTSLVSTMVPPVTTEGALPVRHVPTQPP